MNQRVLVCEDDRAILLLLGRVSARRGVSVECVGTPLEAPARLRQPSRSFRDHRSAVATKNEYMLKESSDDAWDHEQVPRSGGGG